MGRLAAHLLAETMRAFVDGDADPARTVRSVTTRSTPLPSGLDRLIELSKADPDNVERAARLLIAAHYIERIGDRVTNIAEDVVFLATGDHEDLNP